MPDTIISVNSKPASLLPALALRFGVTKLRVSTWVVRSSASRAFGCGSMDNGGACGEGTGGGSKMPIPDGGVEGDGPAVGEGKTAVRDAGVGGSPCAAPLSNL